MAEEKTRLEIQLTPCEKQKIQELAKKEGLSTSAYIRRRALKIE